MCVCMSTREWERHTQPQQTPLHTLQRITVVQGHVGYWDRGFQRKEGIPVIQRNWLGLFLATNPQTHSLTCS